MSTRAGRTLLVGLPLAFLAVFFLWPVAAILGRGLVRGGSLDLAPVGDVLRDPSLRHVAWFTVWQAALSTVVTMAVGLPLAGVVSRVRFPGRALVQALVVVPFVLPTIVVATAFRSLGVERSLVAIVAADCFFNVAVVARVVGTTWSGLDRREEDAARVLGAGPVRTFLRVTVPALRPSIAAAASVVFLFCFTSFGVILVLGGPQYATLETEIYRQTAELLDLRTAAALSVVQLVTVLAVLAVAGALAGRARPTRVRPPAPRPLRGTAPRLAAAAAVLPAVALIVAPTVELLRRSLADDAAGYRQLTTVPLGAGHSPLHAIGTSLLIAATAVVISVPLGLALATALTRRGRAGRPARFTEVLVLLPLGVSAVTVGFGFLIVFDAPPLDLRTSWWIIPIAHAVVALPFVVRGDRPRAAVDRPPRARGGGGPRRGSGPRLARGRPARGPARRGRRRRVRLRHLARRVRRHALHRPARHHHDPGRDLPIPRPAGRDQRGPGDGPGRRPDGPDRRRGPARGPRVLDREPLMLIVTGLSVRYGTVLAVDGLDLVVPDGAIVAILGPSGSGKSSVLRAVAGLEPVSGGKVCWDDSDLTTIPPHRRDFGLMFQDHALFGHQDVAANVGFGLRARGWSASDRSARTTEMLALVGLAGAGARAVDHLSGGEQQRVALARALAPAPRLLMLDEPLASVDRERRAALGSDLHRIVRAAAHRDAPRHPRSRRSIHPRRLGRGARRRTGRAGRGRPRRSGANRDRWWRRASSASRPSWRSSATAGPSPHRGERSRPRSPARSPWVFVRRT